MIRSNLSAKQWVYIIIFTILSTAAIFCPVMIVQYDEDGLKNFFSAFQTNSPATLLIAVGLFFFFKRTFFTPTLKNPGIICVLLSALFSCFTVFGASFKTLNSWNFIFGSGIQPLLGLVSLIGYFVLYYAVLKYLFSLIERPIRAIKAETYFTKWIKAHFFLFAFIVIFIAWLPYLIIFLPGNCPHDGYYQIIMAIGAYPLQDNYPVASTFLLGAVFSLGRLISDSFGVFLTVFLQYIACAAIYAFICKRIRQMCSVSWISLGAIAFYAFVPMWGAYASTFIKDTLSYAFFSLFILSVIQMIWHRNEPVS